MNSNNNLFFIILFFLSTSICANELYDNYKESFETCISEEKKREPLTINDIKMLNDADVVKYLPILKNQRIQECSNDSEMKSLIYEISKSESINTNELSDKYMSIYLSRQLSSFSKDEKERLREINGMLINKGLEINIINLLEDLNNQQTSESN